MAGWCRGVESGDDLGAPAAAAADWVRPGNVVRHPGASGLERASLGPGVHLADLAASMGWGYALLSAQWPSGGGSTWRKLIRTTASKKVGLLVGLRDAAGLPLTEFATAGLKGVRVAVSASGKPDVVESLLALLEEAGKRHLLWSSRAESQAQAGPHLSSSLVSRGGAERRPS